MRDSALGKILEAHTEKYACGYKVLLRLEFSEYVPILVQ